MENEKETSDTNRLPKAALLVVVAYIISIAAAVCIISVGIMAVADTHSCSSMSRTFVGVGIAIALLFLVSLIVVGIMVRKSISGLAGRLAIVLGYAVAMTVSFICLIFGLMVAFNC